MNEITSTPTQMYIAFLRGINVGGHHKVPMADLRRELKKMGFNDVFTLLNSGNVIFKSQEKNVKILEKEIAIHLEETFKFTIPVIIRKADEILNLLKNNPFKKIEENKEIRFYISFLNEDPGQEVKIPWTSEDHSFRILEIRDKNVVSVLDLSKTKTVKGMAVLEQKFGKNITTRNWKTLVRIGEKL